MRDPRNHLRTLVDRGNALKREAEDLVRNAQTLSPRLAMGRAVLRLLDVEGRRVCAGTPPRNERASRPTERPPRVVRTAVRGCDPPVAHDLRYQEQSYQSGQQCDLDKPDGTREEIQASRH